MATNTPNYDFKKPGYTDPVDINDINGNFDKVDTELKTLSNGFGILSGLFKSIREFGVKGDGTDETTAFQNALNSSVGGILYIPKQEGSYYLLDQVMIPSNITIIMHKDVIIQAIDTLSTVEPWDRLMVIRDVSNVIIQGNGATIQMNKSAYTTGEQAHGVDISGSTNVTIQDLNVKDCGGDGFYVGRYLSTKTYSENVRLIRCTSDNNRRQGLSITSVDGFYAEECTFSNTIGTNPQAGVDIEPNSATDKIKNILFRKCKAINNDGNGFEVMLKDINSTSDPVSVTFDHCTTIGNDNGFVTKYFLDGGKGSIKFIDCIAETAKLCGFLELSCSSLGIKKIYERCRAYNCNTNNATTATTSFASSFFIMDIASEPRTEIGNSFYRDCESIDDRGTAYIRRGYATSSNALAIVKKVSWINCQSVGHTVSVFEHNSTEQDIVIENKPDITYDYPNGTSAVALRYLGYIGRNAGTTASSTLNLPISKEGYVYKFRVESAFYIILVPQAGKQILGLTTAVDKKLQSNVIGNFIELAGRSDGNWNVTRVVGTWTEIT